MTFRTHTLNCQSLCFSSLISLSFICSLSHTHTLTNTDVHSSVGRSLCVCLAASVTAKQSGQYFKSTLGHSGTHYLFNDDDVNHLPIMQFYSVLGVSMDTVYGMNITPDSVLSADTKHVHMTQITPPVLVAGVASNCACSR